MAFGDFTVVRAGTKWVLNSSGVLSEVANNVPAFEFNTDGTYRGLLVEPAGTNLILRSAEFNEAVWGKEATSSITATNGTAPDGTATADTYTLGAVPGSARIQQSFTTSSGATITNSVFVKKSVGTHIRYVVIDSATATNGYGAWFNLDTGAVGTAAGFGTGVFVSARIEAYPNSWYRISIAGSITATTGYQSSLYIASADNSGTRLANGAVLLWGAQAETGSVPTSYIPTVASTANRVADSVTLTGASSLIGQTSGWGYVEVEERPVTPSGSFTNYLRLDSGLATNRIAIYKNESNTQVGLDVRSGDSSQANILRTITSISSINKLAFAYAVDDFAFCANGGAVGTDTSGILPVGLSAIRLGRDTTGISSTLLNGWIRSVALGTTRPTDSQLQSLTTV